MRNVLGTVLFALLLVFNASAASATSLTFLVNVNTSSLVGGTYYLDFLLTDGNAASNTIEISDFAGFVPVGAPSTLCLSPCSASGDLSSSVVLNDSVTDSGIVNLFQQFTPSGALSFLVTVTREYIEATPPLFTNPDAFSFSILDDSFFPILTNDPSGAGQLLLLEITGANVGVSDVQTFLGTNPAVSVAASPVPEPASLLLLGAGLISVGAGRRWRRKRQ